MKVIVGLGNPDKQYSNTYHNVGFMALDHFASSNNISFSKIKYNAIYGEGMVDGEKVFIMKPITYMNLSGKAVQEIYRKLKLQSTNILVVYDDIDLPVGAIRTRNNGSAGTHNGMRSVVQELNSTEFPRVRVGIGKPQYGDLASYVLSKIKDEDLKVLNEKFDLINNEIKFFIKNGKLEEKTIK